MESLTNYICRNIKRIKNKYPVPLEIHASEYTFEDHCKRFDIDIISEIEWNKYKEGLWIPYDYDIDGIDYKTFLLEMEIHIQDSEYVISKIDKNFYQYLIAYEDIDNKSSKYVYYKLYGDNDKLNELLNNKEFVSLMNYSNWTASPYLKDDKIAYLMVKPNKTEDISEEVYSYPYIYHYTPKFIYDNKIYKYGICPKHKFGSKYEKVYCFYSKDQDSKQMKQWANIKLRQTDNLYKKEKIRKDGFVLLKIDLSKIKEKITFYKDEESNSKFTFYTFEPIPPFAIINTTKFEI